MAPTEYTEYTVHHNPFSICSLMVRMTLAMRQPPSPSDPNVFHEKLVDIYKDEQLSEEFLTTVNPKGQVPALTGPSLPENLTDSLDITHFLCDQYPSLAPPEHREVIYRLLKELHQIQYLSLSFTPAQNRAGGITVAVQNLLARNDISDKYREALEFKAAYHEKVLVHALEPAPIALAKKQASDFFEKIEALRFAHSDRWLFGDDSVGPTALDAHTVTFIGRLYDAGHKELVPETLRKYGKDAIKGDAWKQVTDGKPTLFLLWMKMQGKEH